VTLEEKEYVRKDPDNGEYRLGLRILDLGNKVLVQMPIHEVALPYLRDLLTRFQETVNLGILEHNEIVYLEVLDSPQAFKMSARVGARDYPHATALGKAILAFLPTQEAERIIRATGMPKRTKKTICSPPRLKEELALIRQRGYSIDDEENEEGACCVGAPLLDYQGKVMAAVSLSGPAPRFSQEVIENMGAALIEIKSQISQKMQYLKKP
jgi:DNA-binding IclR family transcriptional regulator